MTVATIQLAPKAIPEDWPDICAKWNLQPGPSWHKLACATDLAVARSEGIRPLGGAV